MSASPPPCNDAQALRLTMDRSSTSKRSRADPCKIAGAGSPGWLVAAGPPRPRTETMKGRPRLQQFRIPLRNAVHAPYCLSVPVTPCQRALANVRVRAPTDPCSTTEPPPCGAGHDSEEHRGGSCEQSACRIRGKSVPRDRRSVYYCLDAGDRHFPPKYVICEAHRIATGRDLPPSQFNGGTKANAFLAIRGFTVRECRCGGGD